MTQPVDIDYPGRIAAGCNCEHLPVDARCVDCTEDRPKPGAAGAWTERYQSVKDAIDRRWH